MAKDRATRTAAVAAASACSIEPVSSEPAANQALHVDIPAGNSTTVLPIKLQHAAGHSKMPVSDTSTSNGAVPVPVSISWTDIAASDVEASDSESCAVHVTSLQADNATVSMQSAEATSSVMTPIPVLNGSAHFSSIATFDDARPLATEADATHDASVTTKNTKKRGRQSTKASPARKRAGKAAAAVTISDAIAVNDATVTDSTSHATPIIKTEATDDGNSATDPPSAGKAKVKFVKQYKDQRAYFANTEVKIDLSLLDQPAEKRKRRKVAAVTPHATKEEKAKPAHYVNDASAAAAPVVFRIHSLDEFDPLERQRLCDAYYACETGNLRLLNAVVSKTWHPLLKKQLESKPAAAAHSASTVHTPSKQHTPAAPTTPRSAQLRRLIDESAADETSTAELIDALLTACDRSAPTPATHVLAIKDTAAAATRITSPEFDFGWTEEQLEKLPRIDLNIIGFRELQEDASKATATTLLHTAAHHGHQHIVQLLLENGIQPNIKDELEGTALDDAAASDRQEIARCLFTHGCVLSPNQMGNNPLHTACSEGSLNMVKFLVEVYKIDVNAADVDGFAPIFWAMDCFDLATKLSIMQYLIEHGADVNAADESGGTPLLWAVRQYQAAQDDQPNPPQRQPEVISFLLKHDADPYIADKLGRTVFDLLEEADDDEGMPFAHAAERPWHKHHKQLRQTMRDDTVLHLDPLELPPDERVKASHPDNVKYKALCKRLADRLQHTNKGIDLTKQNDEWRAKGRKSAGPSTNGHGNNKSPKGGKGKSKGRTPAKGQQVPEQRFVTLQLRTKVGVDYQLYQTFDEPLRSLMIERENTRLYCRWLLIQNLLYRAVKHDPHGFEKRVLELLLWCRSYWAECKAAGQPVFDFDYPTKHYDEPPIHISLLYVNDNLNIFHHLLRAKFNLTAANIGGFQPVHLAAMHAPIEGMKALLQHDPTIINQIHIAPGIKGEADYTPTGWSPLILAVDHKEPLAMCQLLLQAGADINQADEQGNTALMWAVFKGQHEMVAELLKHAVTNRHATNAHGSTAMHYAIYRAVKSDNHLKTLKLLLDSGILPTEPRNQQKQRPIDLLTLVHSPDGLRAYKLLRRWFLQLYDKTGQFAQEHRPLPQLEVAESVEVTEEPSAELDDGVSSKPQNDTPQPQQSEVLANEAVSPANADQQMVMSNAHAEQLAPVEEFAVLIDITNRSEQLQEAKPITIQIRSAASPSPEPSPLASPVTVGSSDFEALIASSTDERDVVDPTSEVAAELQGDAADQIAFIKEAFAAKPAKGGRGKKAGAKQIRAPQLSKGELQSYKKELQSFGLISNMPIDESQPPKLAIADLSLGRERVPIPAVNYIDNEEPRSNYITQYIVDAVDKPAANWISLLGTSCEHNADGYFKPTPPIVKPLPKQTYGDKFEGRELLPKPAADADEEKEPRPALPLAAEPFPDTPLPHNTQPCCQAGSCHAREVQLAMQDSEAIEEGASAAIDNASAVKRKSVKKSSAKQQSTPARGKKAIAAEASNAVKVIDSTPNVIIECTDVCSCNSAHCCNTVVSYGITVALEVYLTHNKGWAVRAKQTIKQGTFVCEYIGELLGEKQALARQEAEVNRMSYLFKLPNCPYTLDPQYKGNVARFFNHSCNPNLAKKQVYIGATGAGYFPRVAFFAARDIAENEELCMDYGYEEGEVPGGCMVCYCGDKTKCRGTLI